MAATVMAANKFSIHSLLGSDNVGGGGATGMAATHHAQYNACNAVMPQTALTSAVAQEAALRAAFCNGYATNHHMVQPCSSGVTSTPPPAPLVPTPPTVAAANMNGMNMAALPQPPISQQYTPSVTTAAILRQPGNPPITWQPLAIYQDPRWTLPPPQQAVTAAAPQHTTTFPDGSFNAAASALPSYHQHTAAMPAAPCNVGCYGYDTASAMGMAAAGGQRSHVYSLGQLKLKKKKTRTVFTRSQIDQLEMTFNQKRYLSSNDRLQLALSLKMSETQVKVWFQNRRNKWKREIATGGSGAPRPGSADSQSVVSGMEKSSTATDDMNGDVTDTADDCDDSTTRAVSSGEQFADYCPTAAESGQRHHQQQHQQQLAHQNGMANVAHNQSNTLPVQIIPVACR